MSYFVMRVYVFECDQPGCEEEAEIQPMATAPLKRSAERELRQMGWQKNGAYYFCPKHNLEISRD